ncbi:MAG: DUF5667 domain-containing protein [Patescibacteria group bacterium]
MERDVISQLKAMKTNRKTGWVSLAEKQASRARLMTAIEQTNLVFEKQEAFSFSRWWVTNFVSTPITVGASVFVLAVGGWVGTVGAAENSVPGDTLYGVKMISEYTQLRFASGEEKAVLHTQFAEKRLQEATVLEQRGESSEPAITAFKSEMTKAGNQLRELQDYGSEDMLAVASEVNAKVDEMNTSIEANNSTSQAETLVATKGASQAVVDVVVEEYEIQAQDESQQDLDAMFKKEYSAMKGREAFDLGRINMMQSVITANNLTVEIKPTVLAYNISQATDPVYEAMSLAAAGGYRSAFDIMRRADADLLVVETQLAMSEEIVMQAVQLKQNEVTIPEVSETPVTVQPQE